MRSRKPSPVSIVTRMTMRSLKTRVPPVTALRSPPLSRMTGADSPVMADSSTLAMPSITSPSAGMMSPASQTTTSPFCNIGAGTLLFASVREARAPSCRCASRRRARGLRFAAAFGHRFGEIGEQHGEPEPDRQLRDEAAQLRFGGEDSDGRQGRADHGDEHDRVLDHQARIQLLERVADRRPDDLPIKKWTSFRFHCRS